MSRRVVLIHALAASVEPITTAFAAGWPEAELVHLLDDSLSRDRARAGALTSEMIERFVTLGRYARSIGADAVLFTCSAFGPAIEAVARDLAPLLVHKPNTAMIEAAVAAGGRIGLLATFAPTLESMAGEFPAGTEVVTAYVEGALAALQAGDGVGHDRMAAGTAAVLQDCSVIALSQFSLARAADAVSAATGKTILTTPDCAVIALRKAVEQNTT